MRPIAKCETVIARVKTYLFQEMDLSLEMFFWRIAVVVGTLYSLYVCFLGLPSTFFLQKALSNSIPTGLFFWKMTPENLWIMDVLFVVGIISLLFVLVGYKFRLSTIISATTVCILFSASESFRYGWHHGYNLACLMTIALALMKGPGKYALDGDTNTPWTRLEEIAMPLVASSIFFNAGFWKLKSSGFWFFLSDNMRNLVFYRYYYNDDFNEMPSLATLIANNEFLWKLTALGVVFSQMAPFVLLFVLPRRWQWIVSIIFGVNLLGLHCVMGLPNYQWLPYMLGFAAPAFRRGTQQ